MPINTELEELGKKGLAGLRLGIERKQPVNPERAVEPKEAVEQEVSKPKSSGPVTARVKNMTNYKFNTFDSCKNVEISYSFLEKLMGSSKKKDQKEIDQWKEINVLRDKNYFSETAKAFNDIFIDIVNILTYFNFNNVFGDFSYAFIYAVSDVVGGKYNYENFLNYYFDIINDNYREKEYLHFIRNSELYKKVLEDIKNVVINYNISSLNGAKEFEEALTKNIENYKGDLNDKIFTYDFFDDKKVRDLSFTSYSSYYSYLKRELENVVIPSYFNGADKSIKKYVEDIEKFEKFIDNIDQTKSDDFLKSNNEIMKFFEGDEDFITIYKSKIDIEKFKAKLAKRKEGMEKIKTKAMEPFDVMKKYNFDDFIFKDPITIPKEQRTLDNLFEIHTNVFTNKKHPLYDKLKNNKKLLDLAYSKDSIFFNRAFISSHKLYQVYDSVITAVLEKFKDEKGDIKDEINNLFNPKGELNNKNILVTKIKDLVYNDEIRIFFDKCKIMCKPDDPRKTMFDYYKKEYNDPKNYKDKDKKFLFKMILENNIFEILVEIFGDKTSKTAQLPAAKQVANKPVASKSGANTGGVVFVRDGDKDKYDPVRSFGAPPQTPPDINILERHYDGSCREFFNKLRKLVSLHEDSHDILYNLKFIATVSNDNLPKDINNYKDLLQLIICIFKIHILMISTSRLLSYHNNKIECKNKFQIFKKQELYDKLKKHIETMETKQKDLVDSYPSLRQSLLAKFPTYLKDFPTFVFKKEGRFGRKTQMVKKLHYGSKALSFKTRIPLKKALYQLDKKLRRDKKTRYYDTIKDLGNFEYKLLKSR